MRQYIDAETYLPVKAVIKLTLPQVGEVEQTARSLGLSRSRRREGAVQDGSDLGDPGIHDRDFEGEHNVAVDEKLFVKP